MEGNFWHVRHNSGTVVCGKRFHHISLYGSHNCLKYSPRDITVNYQVLYSQSPHLAFHLNHTVFALFWMALFLFLWRQRQPQGMWLSWANLTPGVFGIFSDSEIVIASWLPLSLNMLSCVIMWHCLSPVIDWTHWEVFPELAIQMEEKNWEQVFLFFSFLFTFFSSSLF